MGREHDPHPVHGAHDGFLSPLGITDTMRRLPIAFSLALMALAACGTPTPMLPGTDGGADSGPGPNPDCNFPNLVCGDTCVNPNNDGNHCGRCDNQCSGGTVCNNGACEASCGSLMLCGTSCIDIRNDSFNCGGCAGAGGEICDEEAGLTCQNGRCDCTSGLTACGDECVDTDTSEEHCGLCNRAVDVEAGQACVDGSPQLTREVACNDMVDDDRDGDMDCVDSDCVGERRDCECENGEQTSYEVCGEDGMWGECQGCRAPRVCTTDEMCETAEGYGYTCSAEGQCEFDWSTTFDVYLCSGSWPDPQESTGESDPDLYWLIRIGESGAPWQMSSRLDNQMERSATWNQTVVFSATAETIRRSFYVQLWDADTFNADDNVGACNLSDAAGYGVEFTPVDFDQMPHTYQCEPRIDNAGYNVKFMLLEPGRSPPPCT